MLAPRRGTDVGEGCLQEGTLELTPVSFLGCSLLVCGSRTDRCVLILYPVT